MGRTLLPGLSLPTATRIIDGKFSDAERERDRSVTRVQAAAEGPQTNAATEWAGKIAAYRSASGAAPSPTTSEPTPTA